MNTAQNEKKKWKINLSARLYVTTIPHGTHSSLLPRQRIVGDGGKTGREKFRSPPGAYTLVVVVAAAAQTHMYVRIYKVKIYNPTHT